MTEKAAVRTTKSLNEKFSGLFPGLPLVEPLTQINEKIK